MTDRAVNQGGSSGGTSSSLLERVRARDRLAWERLVQLYGPVVYHWCRRLGLATTDAEDVGQEVFAAVHSAIEGFRHDRTADTFSGWLCVITRNKVHDFRRRGTAETAAGGTDAQRRLLQVPDEPGASAADATPEPGRRAETMLLAQRALALLRGEFTDERWQMFHRVVVDGHAPADVAADCGVSVNVVYLIKSRGLRRLREEFAGLLDIE